MRPNNLFDLLRAHRVVIPPIQRDYAQGRESQSATRVRKRFLSSLAEVLEDDYHGEPLNLDFIYGYVNSDKTHEGVEVSVFRPLDGQQRLTTLFLLHWYAAALEPEIDRETRSVLAKFSYATRSKSRQFCERLVEFSPEPDRGSVRKQIVNQPWCFLSWFHDPTIASMLVVLDAIEASCRQHNISGLWNKLAGEERRIRFHLLEMKDIGLPDDLYIKMNSRGKELTDFEYFKSFFSRCLKGKKQREFVQNIDRQWSDLFWDLFKDSGAEDLARSVDAGFLRFFRFITDMQIARDGVALSTSDEWEIVEQVYSREDRVEFLFRSLDLFTRLEKHDPDYFSRWLYIDEADYASGKTRIFFTKPRVNLFRKCAEVYDDSGRVNPFSLGEQLLLYAYIVHGLKDTNDFPQKARQLRNLIASSEFQMRREHRSSLCRDVENLVCGNPLDKDSRLSAAQQNEEEGKEHLRMSHPQLEDVLFRLEDHHLLRGTISVFDLDQSIEPFAAAFQDLFQEGCDYVTASRAMLAIGDYTPNYGNLKRFGNHNWSTWRELFTPNEYRKGFERTKAVLKAYLQRFIDDPGTTNDSIVDSVDPGCLDWRYYYIRYRSFREWNSTGTHGFFYWEHFEEKPFECTMMFKRQFNGRHWVPFLLAISEMSESCSIENYGNSLRFVCGPAIIDISMQNNGFTFSSREEDGESLASLKRIEDAGLLDRDGHLKLAMKNHKEDSVDRIEACADLLRKIEELLGPEDTAAGG